jgi:glycosyltransferase involved in cell wall biosynthesis
MKSSMKVSGFTFVRNALTFGYPIVESIQSILPIVDEFIVSVGNSEDETLALIQSIGSPKIKIVHSQWDDSLRAGGKVLAVETDKALAAVSKDSDWAFYLQGDEVVHEKYLENIKKSMEQHLNDPKVEGLLFKYEHFYGSYRYVGDSRKWYSREIRIIRNDPSIHSYRDAQGFRKLVAKTGELRKLQVKPIDAYIYHYGWVKDPREHEKKLNYFPTLWNDEKGMEAWKDRLAKPTSEYLQQDIDSLAYFQGTHPEVMNRRVAMEDWVFDFDINQKNFKRGKDRILYWLEKQTGKRLFEYRNYHII